jgi:hypothetical protein
MIRRALLAAVTLVAILSLTGSAPVTAQDPPQIKPFTVEVEVDVVSVTAVVFDK